MEFVAGDAMDDAQEQLDRTEIESFLAALAFVREYAISVISAAGDVAAVASCLSLLPRGWALATLDFTIKMTGAAKGEKLRAKGRVLQAGRTNSVGAADVYIVSAEQETLCGTVLATTRNFQIRPPS